MTVKNIVEKINCSTRYKLVGAKTGKVLHKSHENRMEHVVQFFEKEIAGIYAEMKSGTRNEYAYPVICVWVHGM